MLHHAAPGSRRFDPDPAATAAAGVRLVTIDRAGYGGSDPLPAGTVPTIPGYAADAAAVLDHLGVDVGRASPGGRPAGASPPPSAAARPELAAALFLIGTPAPHEDVPWIPSEHEPAIAAMRADPSHAVEAMADVLSSAPADGDDDGTALLAGGPADAAALEADPDLRRRVTAMLAEGLRTGPIGLAADIVSYTVADWGFDPASIGAPTTCVYGAADLARAAGPRRVVGGAHPRRRGRGRRRRRPPRRRAGLAAGPRRGHAGLRRQAVTGAP